MCKDQTILSKHLPLSLRVVPGVQVVDFVFCLSELDPPDVVGSFLPGIRKLCDNERMSLFVGLSGHEQGEAGTRVAS